MGHLVSCLQESTQSHAQPQGIHHGQLAPSTELPSHMHSLTGIHHCCQLQQWQRDKCQSAPCVCLLLCVLLVHAVSHIFWSFLNSTLTDLHVLALCDPETRRVTSATEDFTFESTCKITLEKELAARQTRQLPVRKGIPDRN